MMILSIASFFSYLFDFFILFSFLNGILYKRKTSISPVFFYLSYIFVEIILFANEIVTSKLTNNQSLIITISISFLTTFLLTFLYQTSILMRMLSSISFQILALFSEFVFTSIMGTIYPELWKFSLADLNIIMDLGSKIFLFFFTIIVARLFGKAFQASTANHNLLIFSTPFITIIIMLFIPLRDINQGMNHSFFTCLYICLSLLNIINYVIINRDYRQTNELFRLKQSESLIQFQQDRYRELSAAYKVNRSLIHDTKKHYFMINNYIENNDYDKLKAYLDISISEIENSYSKINTGNLVIDSFVSNYNNLCEENKIHFVTDLSVDYNRIPISDYDLCIILGNILDNALNACSLNNGKENFIKLTIIITDNDIFYIHTENTFNRFIKKEKRNRAYPFFEHGYGINNVEKIVQNNHGIININADDLFRIDIVLPITDDSKRITPPPPKHPLL